MSQSSTASPDIFDTVAGQGEAQQPSSTQSAQPSHPPPQSGGDIFDQVASGTVPDTSSTPAQPDPNAIQTSGGGFVHDQAGQLEAVGAGLGDGLLHTLNGGAQTLGLPHATLQGAQNHIEDQNKDNPFLNQLGYGGETLLEFLSGDAALTSGLKYGAGLSRIAGVIQTLEQSPRLLQALKVGSAVMKNGGSAALKAGTVQGALGIVHSGGDIGEGAKEGAEAGAAGGLLSGAGAGIKAIRGALSDAGIQPALQGSIRSILSDVANKAGVPEPTALSIRDAVQNVSDGVKSKASDLYKALDTASGGQAQRFRDAAKNVSDQLSRIVGLDDDKEAELLQKQTEIDTAHKDMLDRLKAAGHDPKMLKDADAAWKHQSALSDLSNAVRQSTTGLRPELAKTAAGATSPEAINAKTLFAKVNRLNDSGRLAQAIGKDNADSLLQHVDAAYVQAQKIAQRNKWASAAIKYVLPGAAGAYGVGEAVKGLIGSK